VEGVKESVGGWRRFMSEGISSLFLISTSE